ncbi:hypothetical protein E1B28_012838 [Marasmius oreades]|uniref:Uncharacterized protein n=1 Tax=Marasmius oreades TaxID=181124 RepID=A0A9P7UP45_9AGAR|nr:uncharacterized protein E1B28_012838 [Marasmius oreades]KAG7088893.1 hypothetical protein E1B28_012838 [Marasmius oreades]
MVLADDNLHEAHPYWYARVIGIFHTQVQYNLQVYEVPFLWVRWFGLDTQFRFGHAWKRLPQVGFLDGYNPAAFGFLNPSYVLQASHLIPAFAHGRWDDILLPSIARLPEDNNCDWSQYYVSISSRYVPGIAVRHYFIHIPTGQAEAEADNEDNTEANISTQDDDIGTQLEEEDSPSEELNDSAYQDPDSEWESDDDRSDGSESYDSSQEFVDMDTDTLCAEGYAHL